MVITSVMTLGFIEADIAFLLFSVEVGFYLTWFLHNCNIRGFFELEVRLGNTVVYIVK